MNTYVWCEDKGSGYRFWSNVFGVMYSDFIVESKKNNAELQKSVSRLEDDANDYYILIDYAVDNPNVLRELQRLYSAVRGKQNVHLVCVHSFEFVLLSFQLLEEWVFAKEDSLKEGRENLLKAKDLFVSIMTDDDICGLDETRITREMKVKEIVEHSVLKESFAKVGL